MGTEEIVEIGKTDNHKPVKPKKAFKHRKSSPANHFINGSKDKGFISNIVEVSSSLNLT